MLLPPHEDAWIDRSTLRAAPANFVQSSRSSHPRYIPVTDAVIYHLDGDKELWRCPFMLISHAQITAVMPGESMRGRRDSIADSALWAM